MSLFAELKRRNVFRVGIAYIVVGWLIMQVAEILVPALRLPEWVLTATVYFLFIGFLPAVVFAWAFELTPGGLKRERNVAPGESITHLTGRKLDFAIIVLMSVAVLYLLLDKLHEPPVPDGTAVFTETGQDISADKTGPPLKSIAVLPFINMSGDADNEYFSDGISEEILNELAQVKELKVAGRTSSFAFKDRNEDLRLIGDTLNVTHILEGSVRKDGNKVRVTAQLIEVEDGFHLWSDTYDRELTDIFAIQDEIASSILQELKAELISGERIASTKTDPRAYEKYLRAKQLMYTRSRENLEQSVKLLDDAIGLDESFAPAWAQRGIVAMLLSDQQYGTIPDRDAQAQAKRFLEHALELDDGLAEAWAGLGIYYDNEPGAEGTARAIEYLRRALDINPSLMNAANWLANALRSQDRLSEEIALREDMFARDPLYPPLLGNLQMDYMFTGKSHKFVRVLDQVRPFLRDQPVFNMAEAVQLSIQGQNARALPFAQAAAKVAPTNQFVAAALFRAWYFLDEFDRALDVPITSPTFSVAILSYQGKIEEATILAQKWFNDTGRPLPLMGTMVRSGRYKDLLDFVDERWSSLEAFEQDVPPVNGFGYPPMLMIAKAARETGRIERFEKAMQFAREAHDRQLSQGIGWPFFYMPEAAYWTLAGDHGKAIDFLEKAVDMNWRAAPRIARLYPLLKPLEGEARYEALQQRHLELLNRDRGEAGLEPLEPAYSL